MVLTLDRQQVITIMTLVVTLLWTVTAVVRLFVSWPEAGILDGAMPLILGYWFVSKGAST